MLQLGLSPEAYKNINLPPLKLLTRKANWAFWGDKANGVSKGINAPAVNPIQDLVGVVGKNLFDVITHGGVVNRTFYQNGYSITGLYTTQSATALKFNLKPNTQYTLSYNVQITGAKAGVYGSFRLRDNINALTFVMAVGGVEGNVVANFTTPADISNYTVLYIYGSSTLTDVTNITNIQLEESAVSTAYEPYGKANGLLTGFAFTGASGYADVVAPNGKTVTGIQGDGVNDVIVLPSNAPNPVGLQDFGFAFVFKTVATINNYYAYRGESTASAQWSVYVYTDGRLEIGIHGTDIVVSSLGTITPNTFYKLIFKRVSSRLIVMLNGVEIYNQPNALAIVSKPNARLFARSSDVGGTTHTSFSKPIICLMDYNSGTDIGVWEADQNKAIAKIYGL